MLHTDGAAAAQSWVAARATARTHLGGLGILRHGGCSMSCAQRSRPQHVPLGPPCGCGPGVPAGGRGAAHHRGERSRPRLARPRETLLGLAAVRGPAGDVRHRAREPDPSVGTPCPGGGAALLVGGASAVAACPAGAVAGMSGGGPGVHRSSYASPAPTLWSSRSWPGWRRWAATTLLPEPPYGDNIRRG